MKERLYLKIVIALALIAIPLIYFYPVLLGQVLLAPGDGWAQNFPLRALAGGMIARGELPLWNPFIFGGMPLAASVYPGAFYPLNWLFAILPAKLAMNIVVLATYHIALIGTYVYARRIGIGRMGALFSGIAFTFGGFMINHLGHTSRIAAAAWLPWVLLAIENLARSGSWRETWRWVVLGALFITLQFFAGEPQMMVFTALLCAPLTIFALFKCGSNAARLRFVFAIAAMLICGVLLSAIQLMPSLELLAQSERSDPGPLFFDTYSLPPWQLPGLIIPYFFGGAALPPYRVPYWGKEIAGIMSGYVGMLTWLLAIIAIFSHRAIKLTTAKDTTRIWLWLCVAILSLLLAFGGHMPFGLNHWLYRIPGYNTFRGLYRHQFEFTFAMAILAGYGMSHLTHLTSLSARRKLWCSTTIMGVIIAALVILYRFFGDTLATVRPRPAQAASLANAELIIPIACFVVSVGVLWLSQISNFKSQISNLVLLAILLLDLATYGHFFYWRIATFDVDKRLSDPPAVQLIKSREQDLNSFRIMSHTTMPYDYAFAWPEDENYELINQPNISILRGLQSITGYDVLRPLRVGEITGNAGSVLNGFVQDIYSFGLYDRGLDLLNLKYLIVGHGGATGKRVGYNYDGVDFARTNFAVEFKPGQRLTTEPGGVVASEIALVSSLANSAHLPDGAPVLKILLHTRNGNIIERELQAGRDTSEWAYDRPDVRANIKHQRARIAESTDAGDFQSHSYLGRLKFDRAEIERIEWIYLREDASLYLNRASLHDDTSGVSTPLANFYLSPERWRKLARFDQVEVYQNRRVMPRAWFIRNLIKRPDGEILQIVKNGMPVSGDIYTDARFYPETTAFVDLSWKSSEDSLNFDTADAKVKIGRYEPQRIVLETSNPKDGFLVLSEIDFKGWQAEVDTQPAIIYRTDYTLRGIFVPAGEHRIEFVYRPLSFRMGVALASWGLLTLVFGAIILRRK